MKVLAMKTLVLATTIFPILCTFVCLGQVSSIDTVIHIDTLNVKVGDTLSDDELVNFFKQINRTDQSNIKKPEIRSQSFIDNHNQIIQLILSQGFPQIAHLRKRDRRIIRIACTMTYLHILQTVPEYLLNKFTIDLLKQELNCGRMDKGILFDCMSSIRRLDQFEGYRFSDHVKPIFNQALIEWELDVPPFEV